MRPEELPNVSVVIVTKGRPAIVVRAVESVLNTVYPIDKRQVVVLEETDTPRPICRQSVVYRTIPERGLGFGFARNEALRHTVHPLIVFADDDCVVERDWLIEIVTPIKAGDAVAVGGAVLVPTCGPVGQCENILGFPGGGVRYLNDAKGRVVPCQTFSTCNCAVLRTVLDRSGGFNPALRYGGEDELLSRTIAEVGPIVYNPKAVVRHWPRDGLFRVASWFARRGRSRVDLLRHSPRKREMVLGMIKNSPILRLLAVLAVLHLNGLAVFGSLAALCVAYYSVILWRYRWSRQYYPALRTFLVIPLVKVTMDVGMDVGIAGALCARLKVYLCGE